MHLRCESPSNTYLQNELVNGLRRISHVALPAELRLLQEVWQGGCVVEVEVGDEEQVDLLGVDLVEEGQRAHAHVRGVQACVQHDRFAFELQDVTAAPHFASGAQWSKLKIVA